MPEAESNGAANASFSFPRNGRIRFKLRDIAYPDRDWVLEQLHGDDSLSGRIIDFSNGALPGDEFVVVEVDGLSKPVVVPMKCILERLE